MGTFINGLGQAKPIVSFFIAWFVAFITTTSNS